MYTIGSHLQVPDGAERTKNFGLSVFSEFTPLAVHHRAVNLGQGFPDFHGGFFVTTNTSPLLSSIISQHQILSLRRLKKLLETTSISTLAPMVTFVL